LLACIYIVISPERPIFGDLAAVSTWTIGIIVMLFLTGASAGAALSISNLIDRVDASSTGKMSPTLLYGAIALLSFPLSLAVYGALGSLQRAFSITTSRMMMTVSTITVCLALGAAGSSGGISFLQTVLWGGNVAYLGALGGWSVADAFRR
jgi:hypothetical protein